MLFTRCPECRTTFRITTEALHKADGQVRCGRCSNIFNAYADLREQPDAPPTDARPAGAAAPTAGDDENEEPAPEPEPEPEHIVLETADDDISADEVDAVLEDIGALPVASSVWTLEEAEEPPLERAWLWRAGATLAILVLAMQAVHHFRSDLARQAYLGPAVQSIYAALGAPVVPHWNVEQYELLDWVAAVEPNASGQGNLIITAHVRNRGPDAQPQPHIHLRLLDRWEEAVGSRVFQPDEYLAAILPSTMMQAGDTVEARLIVVDPGPDAYGFELDVCVESETRLDCGAEDIFR